MKHLSYLLFAVAIQSWCCGDVTKLPAEDRRALQDSSRFHEVHSTGDLPAAIVALCADDGRLAEPGQKWNATDANTDPIFPASAFFERSPNGAPNYFRFRVSLCEFRN